MYVFQTAGAQKLDSIFFNLYTDSLKKGTYNYINVEGRFSDGSYLPLGTKEIKLSSSHGKFSGNSLYVDSSFSHDKIQIKAVVIKNPRLMQEIEVYIKRHENNEPLPTIDEVLYGRSKDSSNRKKKRKKN